MMTENKFFLKQLGFTFATFTFLVLTIAYMQLTLNTTFSEKNVVIVSAVTAYTFILFCFFIKSSDNYNRNIVKKSFNKKFLKKIPVNLAMGLLLFFFYAIFRIAGDFFGLNFNNNEQKIELLTVVGIVFVIPLLEELFYRRLLFKKLYEKSFNTLTKTFSVIIPSFLFALMHFQGVTPEAVSFFVFSLVASVFFTIIYMKQKSIIAPIIAHIAYNSLVLIVF